MPVIQLTEDARTVLLNYRWPGNVRQLKNITEQISIFETNRDVDGATLQNYLPQYNIEKLPARATSNEQEHSFFEKERKMLYKTLFEMQKELADLHAKVEELTREKITLKHPNRFLSHNRWLLLLLYHLFRYMSRPPNERP